MVEETFSRDNTIAEIWNRNPITDEERQIANQMLDDLVKYYDEQNGARKLCKIKKFTFRHRDTNTDETVENLYCFTNGSEVHQDIYCILGIQKYKPGRSATVLYRSHVDVDHDNINSATYTTFEPVTLDYKIRVWYERLCLPVKGNVIHNNSKVAGCLLAGQLSGTNPNSAYRHRGQFKTTAEGDEPFMQDYTGGQIKRNKTVNLLTKLTDTDLSPQYFTKERTINSVALAKQKLKEAIENNKQFCAKNKILDFYEYYTQEEVDELKSRNCLSEYYRVYPIAKIKNILEELKPPIVEYDVVCCGLGSAGSGILEQFARLSHFTKIKLIDFDTVEKKNLRNQWYSRGHMGEYKASASRNIYNYINTDVDIQINTTRWEESYLEYTKGKYIISGFDSIETRLALWDFVQEKQLDYKYWIDTRYEGQEASVWFVDLSNQEEKDYYRKRLVIDLETLNEQVEPDFWNDENTREYLERYGITTTNCGEYLRRFTSEYDCSVNGSCGSENCITCWKNRLNQYKIKPEDFDNPDYQRQETNTCLAQNLIAIYKVASSFVTVAVNNIESNLPKGFTHIEVTTDGEINFRKMR